MKSTIIIAGIVALIVMSIGLVLLTLPDTSVEPGVVSPPAEPSTPPRVLVPPVDTGRQHAEQVTQAMLASADTLPVTEVGLYGYTDTPSQYEIMVFAPTNAITILLYNEDLSAARTAAERQLRAVTGLPDDVLCNAFIAVRVHEAVSPEFAPLDLGLSFCPTHVALP